MHALPGLAFASGSATTASIIQAFCSKGHIVSVNDVYGGTYRYLTKVAPTMGIAHTFIDLGNPTNIEAAITSNTKV